MNVPNTMRAVRFYSPKDMRLERVGTPEIGAGELLIRIKFAGVCGTDVRIYRGTKRIPGPRIIGHEFAGTVVSVGAGVVGIEEGTDVTVHPMLSCGSCYACVAGKPNICVNRKTLGYEIDGGFADYVRIPADYVSSGNVVPIPEGVSLSLAGMAEPFAAALHGVERASIGNGDRVVIVGAGAIGLGHLQMAGQRGATVTVIEPVQWKRDLSVRLGAANVFDPDDGDLEAEVLEATAGEGADAVMVDVGIPSVMERSLSLVKKGGRFVLFAGAPHGSSMKIDPNWIHYREIDFTGSSSSTPEELAKVLQMVAAGRLDLQSLQSEILPLERFQDALERKASFEVLKSVLAVAAE